MTDITICIEIVPDGPNACFVRDSAYAVEDGERREREEQVMDAELPPETADGIHQAYRRLRIGVQNAGGSKWRDLHTYEIFGVGADGEAVRAFVRDLGKVPHVEIIDESAS